MPQIITRPYYEATSTELQAEYARIDAEVVKAFREPIATLRGLSQLQLSADVHPDFDRTRYDALKRTAMQLASDLERAVNGSGFAK